MKKNISLFAVIASTLALSLIGINLAAQVAYAGSCRNLRKGDPYYPDWVKCCDTDDYRSLWTHQYGTVKSWSGSCSWWLGR